MLRDLASGLHARRLVVPKLHHGRAFFGWCAPLIEHAQVATLLGTIVAPFDLARHVYGGGCS